MATSSQECFEKPPILQLSQELIDQIIDDTVTPTKKDLMSLSLVCRTFRPRCEKHIFTSIRFSNIAVNRGTDRAKKILKFLDILSRKPYIAGHVRELHLGVGKDQEWIMEPGFLKIMDFIRQSANEVPLKRFEFAGKPFAREQKITNPRRFAESFCAPFITPFLSSLCIKNLKDVPLTLVADCANLKSLDISRTTFRGLDLVDNMNAPKSYPQIKALHFNKCTQAMDTLLQREVPGSHPILDFSKLKIIKTTQWIHDMKSLKALLEVSSGSLEEIYLKLETKGYQGFPYITCDQWLDFGTLLRLHILQVEFTDIGPYPDGITGLFKLLKTISSENVLEELRIVILTDDVGMDDWAILDHEVRRLSSGKPLEFRLHFRRDMDNFHRLQNRDPVKVFVDKLPMIRSDPNIILHLTFDPDHPSWLNDT